MSTTLAEPTVSTTQTQGPKGTPLAPPASPTLSGSTLCPTVHDTPVSNTPVTTASPQPDPMANIVQYYHAVTGTYPTPTNPIKIPVGPNGPIPGAFIPVPKKYRFIAYVPCYRKIHVIRCGWDASKQNETQPNIKFDALYVPTNLTGDAFISCIGGGVGFQVFEVIEKGRAIFPALPPTINYGTKDSKEKTLSRFGFERDNKNKPIWVVLKKA